MKFVKIVRKNSQNSPSIKKLKAPVKQEPYDFNAYVTAVLMAFFVIFSATYKNEDVTAVFREYDGNLTFHPLVEAFRRYAIYFIALAPLCFLNLIKGKTADFLKVNISISIYILISIFVFITFRLMYHDESVLKYIFSAICICFIAYSYSVVVNKIGQKRAIMAVMHAVAINAAILIVLNYINYFSGHGFLAHGFETTGNRYMGSTIHPNFIGLQLAISIQVLIYLAFRGGIITRLLYISLAVAGFYLVFLSGSRTALIAFAAGLIAFLIFEGKFSVFRLVSMALIFAGLVGALTLPGGFFDGGELSQYDRGETSNTREEAWAYLVESIKENPWWGRGYYESFSENSLMRLWAAFGVLPVMLMVAIIIISLIGASIKSFSSNFALPYCMLFSLLASITMASILEATLTDTYSLAFILFVYLIVNETLKISFSKREKVFVKSNQFKMRKRKV